MKKSLTLILILMSAILFSSCGDKSPRELKVVSHYFPGLTTMKAQTADYLTEEYLVDRASTDIGSEKFPDYTILVRITRTYGTDEPQLEIYTGYDPDVNGDFVKMCSGVGGYFVGACYYEHAAGIFFCENPNGDGQPDMACHSILDGRCIAFLEPTDREASYQYCYAVTDYNRWSSAEETAIWRLNFPQKSGDLPTAEKMVVVENTGYGGYAVMADDGTIYVEADGKLFAIDREWNVRQIDTPTYWPYMGFTSMVYLDGSLYLGSAHGFGVLEYVITNDEFVWYPIDELEYSPYWE